MPNRELGLDDVLLRHRTPVAGFRLSRRPAPAGNRRRPIRGVRLAGCRRRGWPGTPPPGH